MGGFNFTPALPLCGCGKAPAYISKSIWSPFQGSACSDECGLKAKAAVESVLCSRKYRWHRDRLFGSQEAMRLMASKAVSAALSADDEAP